LALDKISLVRLRSLVRKRILICTGLFLFGALVGFEAAWFLGFLRPSAVHESHASAHGGAVELVLSGTIDGSDRFIFTHTNVVNERGRWDSPKDVMLNGVLWFDLAQSPEGWTEFAAPLDLTRATITSREGRDIIALEPTANGFDLYFADTQMGAGPYSVTIRIPRK
jgi:hypothetical protein